MKQSFLIENDETKTRHAIRELDRIVALEHREDALNAPLSPLEIILGLPEPKRRIKPLTVEDLYARNGREQTIRKIYQNINARGQSPKFK